jgi:hypothetical protein
MEPRLIFVSLWSASQAIYDDQQRAAGACNNTENEKHTYIAAKRIPIPCLAPALLSRILGFQAFPEPFLGSKYVSCFNNMLNI